jgi:Putative peptidoglycan binding domain
MPNLNSNELRAVIYYAIGVSSEGSDVAYQLSFCGNTTYDLDGSVALEPKGNSGYTIGEMQTDFGANRNAAHNLVDLFQTWARTNRPDWVLNDQQASQLASDLSRDGHHIRDPNYDADDRNYVREHHRHIPNNAIPHAGTDIDQTYKAHLNAYLATDDGKTFVHQLDVTQVGNLVTNAAVPLQRAAMYNNASPEDQAKIFGVVAKAYNQGPTYARELLDDIAQGNINSLDDINRTVNTFPDYMRSGRDDALKGVELFNDLQNASERNPMRDPWQAVLANPLIDPTKLGQDTTQPHLPDQYAIVKGTFVEPEQGRALVSALENAGSYNYGDPANSHSRGFFAEGKDFAQWDRDGNGRAFVNGQWSDFSRRDISLTRNADHTLNLSIARNRETQSLLHMMHPTGHVHAAAEHAAAHAHGDVLHRGMHGNDVQKLQTQLGELGYLNNTGTPDDKFGSITLDAVKAFQHDHHLIADGRVGTGTQQAIQDSLQPLKQNQSATASMVTPSAASEPGLDDPRNPANANYALFNNLKERFPDASENRLMQFTAACHIQGINEQNLKHVHFDQQKGLVGFGSGGLAPETAIIDVKQPSPQPAQSIQQIQQYDQQHAINQAQFQTQQTQISQQQGPTL